MYYVYALFSKRYDKIYIGFSENPERRLQFHNDPDNKGWSKSYQPWEIIYTETLDSKREALIREKQLKSSRGRAFVREIISHRIPKDSINI